MGGVVPVPPNAATLLPPLAYERLIAQMGQRTSWFRSHSCPCVFAAAAGLNGDLPIPGSPQRGCVTCNGLGTYWDPPSIPFRAWIKFVEMSPTPDEPGVRMNQNFGVVVLEEPSLSLPYQNPLLQQGDPAQPTAAWNDAGLQDIFVGIDMLARWTAKLQVSGITYLPYQQNLQIAPIGAVTVWNPTTKQVEHPAYTINGTQVLLTGYPENTSYMVEFKAAPMFVAFRPAGGVPHVRPFSGGLVKEPRRFKLQMLDFWLRQRGPQAQAAGTVTIGGTAFPQIIATANIS